MFFQYFFQSHMARQEINKIQMFKFFALNANRHKYIACQLSHVILKIYVDLDMSTKLINIPLSIRIKETVHTAQVIFSN